jgi:hypothetical protein
MNSEEREILDDPSTNIGPDVLMFDHSVFMNNSAILWAYMHGTGTLIRLIRLTQL